MRNRLASSDSAYLLQHAGQPVDWYSWGEAALARARREDKPIFLSIGYSSCHWCHVMAHESFADEEVAALLAEYFISVKVDREERPDLDQIYMLACQFFTGSGGWPLSVFITPEGLPFFAGTYFPKRGAPGLQMPGFLEIIKYLGERWRGDRESLLKGGREVGRLLASFAAARPEPAVLSADLLGQAAAQLADNFDREAGGFGAAPKFPAPHQLLFLLRWYRRSRAPIALEMVEKTLEKMAGGGIFDHLGGGFHRYAVDKDWLIPHFEKMLYDQAALILAYSEAQALAPRPLYAEVVAAVVDYLEKEMRAPDGAFYASQDADSEGREGAYYIWKKSEIIELLGPEEGEFCARAYGVSEAGNFADEAGASVLSRPLAKDDDAAAVRLAAARQRLLAARRQRPRPRIDHKVITAWNGLALAALARAAAVFAEPRYLALAEAVAAALLPVAGVRLSRRPQVATSPAFLDDYAFLIFGLLELEAVAPGKGYGSRAALFSEEAVKYFA
ncbi:MAG: thioredoxin domain-containing protein, partial [Deltaproteobacteria bacterium]|nr:thioredoxin domain-containing protein [Deltaproteobacteria bacterium]